MIGEPLRTECGAEAARGRTSMNDSAMLFVGRDLAGGGGMKKP